MIPYNNIRSARRNDPGSLSGPDLGDYMKTWDMPIPHAARRRWRRRARRERLVEEAKLARNLASSGGRSAPHYQPRADPCEGLDEPDARESLEVPDASESISIPPPAAPSPQREESVEEATELSPRVLAAIEYVRGLEQNPGTEFQIDDLDATAGLNPSKIGRAAEQGALLLDVFRRVKPVNDNQLTPVQRGLVTSALSSVLEITREIRVLAITADEELDRLPVPDDPAMSVYLGCVICFTSVSEMLLMPCHHLALCEVCCNEIHTRARDETASGTVRCPVCRSDILETIKIYRG